MNERDKLIELLNKAFDEQYSRLVITAPETADHLLANGVIVPPVKVGDEIYWLGMFNQKVEGEVVRIGAYIGAKTAKTADYVFDMSSDDIGKTVFLSREEAEKALQGVE